MYLNLNTFKFTILEYTLSYPHDIAENLSNKHNYGKVFDKVNLLYISLTMGDNTIIDPI